MNKRAVELLSILAGSGREEMSGRELAGRYREETNKDITYGTLYTTLRRMKDDGWVKAREDSDEDGRIKYFRITGSGAAELAKSFRESAFWAKVAGVEYKTQKVRVM